MLLALLLNASALFNAVVAALVANVSAFACAVFAALVANVSAFDCAVFAALVANVSAVVSVLAFADVTSVLNASICEMPFMSRKFRCGSVLSNQMSPVTGLLGAADPFGTFNEA